MSKADQPLATPQKEGDQNTSTQSSHLFLKSETNKRHAWLPSSKKGYFMRGGMVELLATIHLPESQHDQIRSCRQIMGYHPTTARLPCFDSRRIISITARVLSTSEIHCRLVCKYYWRIGSHGSRYCYTFAALLPTMNLDSPLPYRRARPLSKANASFSPAFFPESRAESRRYLRHSAME